MKNAWVRFTRTAHEPATALKLVNDLWLGPPEGVLCLAVSEVLAHQDALEARGAVEQDSGPRVGFRRVSGPRPTAA